MNRFLFLLFISCCSTFAFAQDMPEETPDTVVIRSGSVRTITNVAYPHSEFLPKGHLFAPILLDPLEAQTYASVLPAYWQASNLANGPVSRYKGTFVPFALGLRKPFFRWYRSAERSSELSLDVASFTQFEVYYDAQRNKQRRQLVNTDYRVSILYNVKVRDHSWRFRLYHLSSHLGDDYLIRNQINYYLPNSVNYEVVDVTYSHETRGFRKYIGVGYGIRVAEERKHLSGQAGFYYRQPHQTKPQALVRFVGGLDFKVWQQIDYRPGIKAGLGVEVGRTANNLTFLLESYTGFRPYSVYEQQQTRWVGIGVYFNPI